MTSSGEVLTTSCAVGLAFALIILGLHRILRLTGGLEFLDRLALLSLLAVMPQAILWLAFKFIYPFFDVRFRLLRIIPLYLAAIVAALIYSRSSAPVFSGVPWTEIGATSAAAALLILAIGLSSGIASAANSTPPALCTWVDTPPHQAPLSPSGTCQQRVNLAKSQETRPPAAPTRTH